MKILLLLILLNSLQLFHCYVVDITVTDTSRNKAVQYCGLKKTSLLNDYNGIIYNFTYFLPPFSGCYDYFNLSTNIFNINGSIWFNQTSSILYFDSTNQTFTFLNSTRNIFNLSDNTNITFSFNDTYAVISFDDYKQTIYLNQTTTWFSKNITIGNATRPQSMAIFMPINYFKCSMKTIVSNIATSLTQIVMFGGDGPFVCFQIL